MSRMRRGNGFGKAFVGRGDIPCFPARLLIAMRRWQIRALYGIEIRLTDSQRSPLKASVRFSRSWASSLICHAATSRSELCQLPISSNAPASSFKSVNARLIRLVRRLFPAQGRRRKNPPPAPAVWHKRRPRPILRAQTVFHP